MIGIHMFILIKEIIEHIIYKIMIMAHLKYKIINYLLNGIIGIIKKFL
jgi:hypothetical protein